MKTTTTQTINEVLRNGNSTTNQRIKEKFIEQHVYANVNSMVEYIINKGHEDSEAPFNLDDVTNYYTYPEYINTFANFLGGDYDMWQAEIERLNDLKNELEDKEPADLYTTDNAKETIQYTNSQAIEQIEEDIESLENLENEPQDIFEWWMVSSYLCEKLEAQGCCVIDSEGIWGRTTTGQAILLDYVITRICADMEILEGQSNSWA